MKTLETKHKTPSEEPHDDGPTPKQLRRMELVGWSLYAVWAAILITWGILQPEPYADGWWLVLQLAFFGQAVNIAYGISTGFSQLYLLIQSATQDILLALVAYPWIVRAYRHGVRDTWFGRWINRMQKAAQPYRRIVEPFGAIGLWIFVFFPFWSTGPLVGVVVGYLMGMRTRVVFTAVFLGHLISVTALIFLFDHVHEAAEAFNANIAKYLPVIVLAILVTITLIYRGVRSLIRRRQT